MATDEVVQRLDTLIALLQLAHRDDIERARSAIRADRINAAILDGAKKWTPAGKLTAAVAKKTSSGSSTVRDRIAALIELGVLQKQGGGPATQYKATALI